MAIGWLGGISVINAIGQFYALAYSIIIPVTSAVTARLEYEATKRKRGRRCLDKNPFKPASMISLGYDLLNSVYSALCKQSARGCKQATRVLLSLPYEA